MEQRKLHNGYKYSLYDSINKTNLIILSKVKLLFSVSFSFPSLEMNNSYKVLKNFKITLLKNVLLDFDKK
jgi:hypothetical protein